MLNIAGIWTGKAGEPKPALSVDAKKGTGRFFYQLENDLKETVKSIVHVYVDGTKILAEFQDFDVRDGLDTGFFDIPASFQYGSRDVIIEVFSWDTNPEIQTFMYKSPKLTINYGN